MSQVFLQETETTVPIIRGPGEGKVVGVLRDQSTFKVLSEQTGGAYAILEQKTQATKRPWSAKDYPYIADWLKVNEKPLALVIEASKRPEYFNPLAPEGAFEVLGALLPNVQNCRELAIPGASVVG